MPKTPTLPTRPLYVVAGATDLAVELARGYVTEAQKKTQDRVTGLQKSAQKTVKAVDIKPSTVQARLQRRARTRVEDAKAIPSRVEAYVNGTVNDLGETYDELATRGERLVARIRRQQATQDATAAVKTTTSRAKATRTTAKKSTTATKRPAKATGTAAKKAAKKTVKAVEAGAEKVGDN